MFNNVLYDNKMIYLYIMALIDRRGDGLRGLREQDYLPPGRRARSPPDPGVRGTLSTGRGRRTRQDHPTRSRLFRGLVGVVSGRGRVMYLYRDQCSRCSNNRGCHI